ncbi:MAG: T9SS type A sorting domain-containing protein [Cytophaga sp.]|uniref:T9SS type A sorting domain-containing protein n=1 Tax=Cytophaga sp. TaxID=29535 RepID=UPI003F7E85AB
MINKRFLSFLFFTFLIQLSSYAQFELIKDFDASDASSFAGGNSGILYSVGTKVLVQYDSIVTAQYTGKTTLAAVGMDGKSQGLTSVTTTSDYANFYDFKTLPDGRVAFVAIESGSSFKVIVTDGTLAGTSTVYSAAEPIEGLELIDNGLYFTYDGTQNHALMKIELTTLTVSQVVEFGYFHMISDISKLSNTSLIFMAPDPDDNNDLKLYVSDGTAAGTMPLATINSGSEVSQNTVMTQVGSKVFFFYKRPGTDCCNDLWVTDGTNAGTQKIKEFNIVFFTDFDRLKKAIGLNGKFYFAGVESGANANNDEVLWVSDGTVAGTMALNGSDTYTKPKNFTVFKNELYFISFNQLSYSTNLCKTDGTVAGTGSLSLKHGTTTLYPYSIASDGNYIYMGASNVNAFGAEVFRYDGVSLDCDMLEGISGGSSSQPDELFVNGTDLYFTANLSATGNELYTGSNFISGITTATKASDSDMFVLYPNPAIDQVTIKCTEKIKSVRVMSQLGNVLTESTDNSIQLNSYTEGIYFVEVQFVNGEAGVQKIVVVK